MAEVRIDLTKIMNEYVKGIDDKVDRAADQVGKETVAMLKQTSPKKTGRYAKGWRVKKNGRQRYVYNAVKPQLTHLLEHGHAKRGGGRVRAYVHIKPAEEAAAKRFVELTSEAIKDAK
jgi:hypothetical protein